MSLISNDQLMPWLNFECDSYMIHLNINQQFKILHEKKKPSSVSFAEEAWKLLQKRCSYTEKTIVSSSENKVLVSWNAGTQ